MASSIDEKLPWPYSVCIKDGGDEDFQWCTAVTILTIIAVMKSSRMKPQNNHTSLPI